MRVGFRPLPGAQDITARPILDVRMEGLSRFGLACLIDTGSLHNRFAGWTAEAAGLDLSSAPAESLGVGGRPTIARVVTVRLAIEEFIWEAPVWFCHPWPWDFQLLGQEGFFRWFRVLIEAADRSLEITPVG